MSIFMSKLSGIFSLNFFLVFFVFSTASFSQSFAQQQNNYLVENVAASASAKSAGDAKNVATANARRDAFVTLLSRLSLPSSAADKVSNDEISEMVRSEQITDEKIAGSNYSAVFNILFARSAVDRVLNGQAGKQEDAKVEAYLLIPVKILKQKASAPTSSKFALWDENNEWKGAIEKNLKAKSVTKFALPENDISNVSMINNDNVENLEYSQIEPLFSRYKAVGAYVVFFYFDDIENKVSITVKSIKKLQKKQVKLSFINVDRLSQEALLAKVADKTIEYLLGSQSEEGANVVKLEVQILSFGNWIALKNKIENSNLINQMNIESLSKDYVKVSVNYVGADPDIVTAFAKLGLSLKKKSDDSYTVSAMPTQSLSQ